MRKLVVVASMTLLVYGSFGGPTTEPTTQPNATSGAPLGVVEELAQIEGRLANKSLTDGERARLAARKIQLRSMIAERPETPSPSYILTQNAPIGIRQYLQRCAEEKTKMLSDASVRREQLKIALAHMAKPKNQAEAVEVAERRRELQQQSMDISNAITYLLKPSTIVSPLLLDGRTSNQSLLPGMMGRVFGLKIISIIDDNAAIVHLFMPQTVEKHGTSHGPNYTVYNDILKIPEKKAENPQNLYLSGLKTQNFYVNAVYDNELVVEIGDIITQKDTRLPSAKVINMDDYLAKQ